MLIDFHTHAFPDALAERASTSLRKTRGLEPHTDGTISGAERNFGEWGVDIGVVLNIATRPGQETNVNNFAAQHNSGAFRCFGSVHPDYPDAVAELHRIRALGLHGVKLHPDFQNFFLEEERLFPIYETLIELELPVAFHMGFDPLSPAVIHAEPEALSRVLQRFPSLTVIGAHMGGSNLCGCIETYLIGKPLYLDTALASLFCTPQWLCRMARRHGVERVLFGSDCPWCSPAENFDFLLRSGLTDDEIDRIAFENAAQLLGLRS